MVAVKTSLDQWKLDVGEVMMRPPLFFISAIVGFWMLWLASEQVRLAIVGLIYLGIADASLSERLLERYMVFAFSIITAVWFDLVLIKMIWDNADSLRAYVKGTTLTNEDYGRGDFTDSVSFIGVDEDEEEDDNKSDHSESIVQTISSVALGPQVKRRGKSIPRRKAEAKKKNPSRNCRKRQGHNIKRD